MYYYMVRGEKKTKTVKFFLQLIFQHVYGSNEFCAVVLLPIQVSPLPYMEFSLV